MYALDAKTGKIVWEFYLVPKTDGDPIRFARTHTRTARMMLTLLSLGSWLFHRRVPQSCDERIESGPGSRPKAGQQNARSSKGSNRDIKGARMFNRFRTNRRISVRVDSTTSDCLLGTKSLIDDDVFDTAGRFRGEIEEILIDVRTGCVRYVVLALGGFLGMGRKRIAVPWSAVTPNVDYRRCIINLALIQLMAVAVLPDDPWLQRVDLTARTEDAYLPRQQAVLGITPPEHRSTLPEPGPPKSKGQRD